MVYGLWTVLSVLETHTWTMLYDSIRKCKFHEWWRLRKRELRQRKESSPFGWDSSCIPTQYWYILMGLLRHHLNRHNCRVVERDGQRERERRAWNAGIAEVQVFIGLPFMWVARYFIVRRKFLFNAPDLIRTLISIIPLATPGNETTLLWNPFLLNFLKFTVKWTQEKSTKN